MKKHAVLPAEALEHTISDMQPGESGWTVPWAMSIDVEHHCWLRSRYTIHSEPGGTVQMRVERRTDGSYHVWLAKDYRYHTENIGPGGGFLPVVELHGHDDGRSNHER